MNYLQSNNNRYRHHFCIFAKYRINMKREILYQKIAGTIAWQIKTGIWKAGEKLPSLRTISNEYGVSLNTAIQVYYELEKEGFIISRPKSGYIVNYKPLNLSAPATTQPSAQSPGKEETDLIMEVYHSIEDSSITRFSLGIPEDVLLPIAKLNKELAKAMYSLPGNGTRYEDPQGNIRLRNYIARFAYSWNGNLTEDDIVTTTGVTNSISLALSVIAMPREKGDRPNVVPDGAVNFAFLGQFAETARDTIFTTEYSIRTGMEAVYSLLDIDRGVPEVWGSTYDVRDLVNASVALRDGRKITDMDLGIVEKLALKELLKKVRGTDVEKLLVEHGAI